MSDAATLSILLDIRARLDALEAAKKGLREIKEEAASTTREVREGFGDLFGKMFGAGMAVNAARRAISMGLNLVKGAIRDATESVETAKNLEIALEGYEKLRKVIKASGGDVGALNSAIERMGQSLVEAREPGPAKNAFDFLRLDSIELESMPIEERFIRLGRAANNSADRLAAWGKVGDIIGDKTVRQLREALNQLADSGFSGIDEQAAEAEARGARAFHKLFDNLANSASLFKSKIVEDVGSLLDGVGMRGDLTDVSKTFAPNPEGLKRLRDQREAVEKLKLGLVQLGEVNDAVVNDPSYTDQQRKFWTNYAAATVVKLLDALQKVRAAMPLDISKGETKDKRDAELSGYDATIMGLTQSVRTPPSAYRRRRERLDNLETKPSSQAVGNSDYLTGAQGLDAGAMDWATSLGSQGEQIAAAMQSTIGASVSSISQGIYGWITGTQSFGDVLASLGSTVLQTLIQTIVQMGVQWVITGGMAKASMAGISLFGSALRKKEVGETIAAETAKKPAIMSNAAGASAGSFGLSAVIGIALLLALMAAFGGFADGGYTGHGGKYDVAGVVHRGESVWSQADIARAGGVDAVEAMRMSGGQNMIEASPVRAAPVTGSPVSAPVAVGGLIAGALAAAGMAGGRRESPRNTYLLMDRAEFSRMMQEDSSGWFQDMSAQWARKNA